MKRLHMLLQPTVVPPSTEVPSPSPASPSRLHCTHGAIRSSAGGQMTRNTEVFLASVCAKHLTDSLLLAGFVFMRRAD